MRTEQILEISKALLTPLIAIVATYIAWQQWRTNKQKLLLERYDRRLRVYEEVRKILSVILRDAKASYDDLLRFRTATRTVHPIDDSQTTIRFLLLNDGPSFGMRRLQQPHNVRE